MNNRHGNNTHWVYLSPHLDDAVYSCGGLIWEQVERGMQVEVWTIFAGDPPPGSLTPFARSLHERWKSGGGAAALRRDEDARACAILGIGWRHFDYPDCIYRYHQNGRPVIEGEGDLFRAGYEGESHLAARLAQHLARELPAGAVLAVPYGYGSHVDHQLARRAAALLPELHWAYADYPYAVSSVETLSDWLNQPGESYVLPVSPAGLERWQQAVAAYASQISTFWTSTADLREKIAAYHASGAGSRLTRLA
ncbi:MAG: PIG-L family deacetylase [Anaerolineaceae bacterium]